MPNTEPKHVYQVVSNGEALNNNVRIVFRSPKVFWHYIEAVGYQLGFEAGCYANTELDIKPGSLKTVVVALELEGFPS